MYHGAMSTVRRLYISNVPSGNCYKIQLLLGHLGAEYETVHLDILADPPETRAPAYLAVNPAGKVPGVELASGEHLAESNAILWYLAADTPYWPETRLDRGRALQWMFFEQYSHEPYIAVLRYWTRWGGLHTRSAEQIETWRTRGQAALDVMESHLGEHRFFAGDRYSIADIALYAYSHTAGDFAYRLGDRTRAWLDRVREQPGHVIMRDE